MLKQSYLSSNISIDFEPQLGDHDLTCGVRPCFEMKDILDWTNTELRIRLVEEILGFQPLVDLQAWTDQYGYGHYFLTELERDEMGGLKRRMILPDPVHNLMDLDYCERRLFEDVKPSYQFIYATIVNKLAMIAWKRHPFEVDPTFLALRPDPKMRSQALALYLFSNRFEIIEELEELI